jgi:PEP-CTERM motif-containing protein
MSGIVGILQLDGAPIDVELLQRLVDFQKFRGPDAQRLWISGHVGLGHTLLAANEQSIQECQPFHLGDNIWIAADARVDGRSDLVTQVSAKITFRQQQNVREPQASVSFWLQTCHETNEQCCPSGRISMVRRSITILLTFAAFALLSASSAKADETFTWTLPASPTIGSTDFMTGNSLMIMNVPLTENGTSLGNYVFDFYSTGAGGGFDAFSMGSTTALNEFGPQVYMGGEDMPTFLPGTHGPFNGQGSLTAGMTGVLDITDAGNGNDLFTYTAKPTATTPEPSSLLLLGAGTLALLGFTRKRIIATASHA